MAGPQEPSLFERHQRVRENEAMVCIGHSHPGSSAAEMQQRFVEPHSRTANEPDGRLSQVPS